MLRCASLYRPITSPDSASPTSLPNSHQRPIDIVPSDTVRFRIPAGSVLPSDGVFQQLGGGLEPTHCLAVRPRTKSVGGPQSSNERTPFGSAGNVEEGEVGRMIPIQYVCFPSRYISFIGLTASFSSPVKWSMLPNARTSQDPSSTCPPSDRQRPSPRHSRLHSLRHHRLQRRNCRYRPCHQSHQWQE